MKQNYLLVMLFIFISSCSENDSNTNVQIEESVFDTQAEAIDKAEALEQQILDAAAKQSL